MTRGDLLRLHMRNATPSKEQVRAYLPEAFIVLLIILAFLL